LWSRFQKQPPAAHREDRHKARRSALARAESTAASSCCGKRTVSQQLADSHDIRNLIDRQRVKESLERKDGLAREVTAGDAHAVLDSISKSFLEDITDPAIGRQLIRIPSFTTATTVATLRGITITNPRLTVRTMPL
jgi:uncharacterized protein